MKEPVLCGVAWPRLVSQLLQTTSTVVSHLLEVGMTRTVPLQFLLGHFTCAIITCSCASERVNFLWYFFSVLGIVLASISNLFLCEDIGFGRESSGPLEVDGEGNSCAGGGGGEGVGGGGDEAGGGGGVS